MLNAVILAGAVVVAAAVVWAGATVAGALRRPAGEATRDRAVALLSLFAPAVAAGADDPRALLAWQPLVKTARQIEPDAFALLDGASGDGFPFGAERVQAAHAKWSADWLAWEAAHDAEYKMKAAAAEEELERSQGSPAAKARLANVEREKLEQYQRRYAEYVRVGKALQALLE